MYLFKMIFLCFRRWQFLLIQCVMCWIHWQTQRTSLTFQSLVSYLFSAGLSGKFAFKDDVSHIENKIQVQTFIKLELVGFEKHQSWKLQSTFARVTIEYSGQLSPFKTLSLGFILKKFLKFRNFQPRYSYKKRECILLANMVSDS